MLLQPSKDDGYADGTRASLAAVFPQSQQLVEVAFQDVDGVSRVAVLPEGKFHEETRRQVTALNACRSGLQQRATSRLDEELGAVYAELHGSRIARFADWYYGYTTAYELLRVGVMAAAASVPTSVSAREASSDAVAQAVLDKYLAIVLRPAVLEPALRRAFERSHREAHQDFCATVEAVHAEALPLLQANTTHLQTPSSGGTTPAPAAQLSVDWRFARKLAGQVPGAHDRPAGGVPSLVAFVGGAAAGKVMAGAAGSAAGKAAIGVAGAAAGKAMAGAAGKTLASKLAAPFVAKAASAAGAAVSAGAAASASGPVGAVVGAGVGLGVDYAMAKTLELARRAEFERDVATALATAHAEWRDRMTAELARAVDVLVDDVIQLTANQGAAGASETRESARGA